MYLQKVVPVITSAITIQAPRTMPINDMNFNNFNFVKWPITNNNTATIKTAITVVDKMTLSSYYVQSK